MMLRDRRYERSERYYESTSCVLSMGIAGANPSLSARCSNYPQHRALPFVLFPTTHIRCESFASSRCILGAYFKERSKTPIAATASLRTVLM